MKNRFSLFLALALTLSTPIAALAMSHGSSGHDHGAKKEMMDHGSHGAAGHEDMKMLGESTVEQVKSAAHLKDVGEAMKKAGMSATHHFMVLFADAANGKPITEGNVALKVTGPDGKTADPVKLVGMDGHFGADIVLTRKGTYRFEVGSKLPDGKVRKFEFNHTL